MSFEVSDRIKKILGLIDKPMEMEGEGDIPAYLQGAENDPKGWSGEDTLRGIGEIKPLSKPDEKAVEPTWLEDADTPQVTSGEVKARQANMANEWEERRKAALGAREQDQSTIKPTANEGTGEVTSRGPWGPSGGGRRGKF